MSAKYTIFNKNIIIYEFNFDETFRLQYVVEQKKNLKILFPLFKKNSL